MILLDTNLISEPWKPQPNPKIIAWIDAQAIETLFLSAITIAELRFGIAAMPPGKCRQILHERLENQLLPLFAQRILPFDLKASRAYADLMAKAKTAGQPINQPDGLIAATHNLSVATRDTTPFHTAGIPTINPWTLAA